MRIQMVVATTAALFLAASNVAAQQDPVRREAVHFQPGTTGATLSGRISGRDTVLYTLNAEADQTIDIRLESANNSLYFNLYAPGRGPGDEAIAAGTRLEDLNHYRAPLPQSGEYTVSVYLYRNAARAGQVADYTLRLSITGDAPAVVQGDFADGLQGGPDFWVVATSGNGVLNLRADASVAAGIVGQATTGTVLRNLGCRTAEARRWCRVATLADPGIVGWAAGDYLRESGGP